MKDVVHEFFERCKHEQPDLYKEVCEKYPTVSGRQWKTIRKREISVGLLGLQPAHISPEVAQRHGLESVHESEE